MLKQPEVGAFVRDLVRLLAAKSTQEEVQEAGAAAGAIPDLTGLRMIGSLA